MTRWYVMTVVAAFVATVMTAGAAAAHPGHDRKITGTVTKAAADHVTIKDPDGKDATAVIGAGDDKSIAKVIELGPGVATKQPGRPWRTRR